MRAGVLIPAVLAAALVARPVLAESKGGTPETTPEGRAIYPAELRGQGSLPD